MCLQSEVEQLVVRELESLAETGRTNHNVEVTWDEEVVRFLSHSYNQNHGVRSIQTAVDNLICPLPCPTGETSFRILKTN